MKTLKNHADFLKGRETMPIRQCKRCSEIISEQEFEDGGICESCWKAEYNQTYVDFLKEPFRWPWKTKCPVIKGDSFYSMKFGVVLPCVSIVYVGMIDEDYSDISGREKIEYSTFEELVEDGWRVN